MSSREYSAPTEKLKLDMPRCEIKVNFQDEIISRNKHRRHNIHDDVKMNKTTLKVVTSDTQDQQYHQRSDTKFVKGTYGGNDYHNASLVANSLDKKVGRRSRDIGSRHDSTPKANEIEVAFTSDILKVKVGDEEWIETTRSPPDGSRKHSSTINRFKHP